MDDLLSEFLAETHEHLAELDLALLAFERSPTDADTLSHVFRLIHSVKGTCGFLGLTRLSQVAHATEALLAKARDGRLAAGPELVGLILRALDRLRAIVAALGATGQEPDDDDSALIEALEGRTLDRSAGPHDAPAAALREPEAAPAWGTATHEGAAPQSLRVSVGLLDELMTLAGELVLTRNQLLQLGRGAQAKLAAPLQRLSQITSELQEGVMKTRMQPIGIAWNKFPRLVRELSRELGKKITLVTSGAATELDRQVLELIRDPLTHMVRNSADHGIETPARRLAAGKPETGRITLHAYHQGGYVLIEVSDDGQGISLEGIRAKIRAGGRATAADLAAMSDADLCRFIFQPGFSTAATVTEVSGRGVGMDVVKTHVEKIGGTVELTNRPGQGCLFTFRIPLTLAIVTALIVEAGGVRFAIPQLSVHELVRVAGGEQGGSAIEWLDDAPVLRLRDRLLPLVSLCDLLGLAAPAATSEDSTIVVAAVGTARLGIIVARVFDTEEIVVKPVAALLRHLTLFGGTTILGDGAVVMILDPNGIARSLGISLAEVSTPEPAAARDTDEPGATVPMLLFKAGAGAHKAVPLGLVARIESFARAAIETTGQCPVVRYRDRLMPLVAIPGAASATPIQPVLVFIEGERAMGLMIDEIVDIVHGGLDIELTDAAPGLLGTAVIGDRIAEVIDAGFWLTRVCADWFDKQPIPPRRRKRLMLVEDSHFFRQMIAPALLAAGCETVSADTAAGALAQLQDGIAVDAVVSDLEMPAMHGLAFARTLRASDAWRGLPLIALSGLTGDQSAIDALTAGFDAFVAKSDRHGLLQTLQRCLDHAEEALDA